jgi:hypothetical protein
MTMMNKRYKMQDARCRMQDSRSRPIMHHASCILHQPFCLALLLGAALAAAAANAAEVGAPVEVAPQAGKTRQQTWASAAWCEGAKSWLVVWREGFLNEAETGSEIWCARVSADGKALDAAGVRLTKGPGLKDRPEVASDGKGWLVVWEDLSNGKDFDVRAARVSGEGKPLDAESVLVAGGEHNQCRPDVAFSSGNYFVVWQALSGANGQRWPGYCVQGVRVSPEGKVVDKPADIGANASQCNLPVVAASNGSLVAAYNVTMMSYVNFYVHRREVDPASGQPRGAPPVVVGHGKNPAPAGRGEQLRTPALALGPEGGLLVAGPGSTDRREGSVLVVDKTGAARGEPVPFGPFGDRIHNTPRLSVAAAGDKQFLVVGDYSEKQRFNVGGWLFAADGKPIGDVKAGFGIAADAGKDSILPAAASGPAGACLVVYSEVRGADDVKVLARVVK